MTAGGHARAAWWHRRLPAILAVVVAHQTFWPVFGGAAAMVILMGMSVAGFRSTNRVCPSALVTIWLTA